ncbi:hypothetical protein JG688_00012237 [Phytophthora aleatoria]|uniref:Uncharacterized protein n=1 Tax=Phytophthora aleatoria TaxID=2496075 RepID=A0A8J5M267_9STRA|nr:hypothetical protein JG688_00012237 [Phytophthora aleatoria]
MTIMVGDSVLVSHGSSLLDAEVKELQSGIETGTTHRGKVLVQYLVESDRPNEWVTRDRVLEDSQSNRELQEKVKAIAQKKSELSGVSTSFEKLCGPKRLDAMAAWMNSVDGTLARLDQDKEAMEKKAALEASELKDLKRVRVAEETAMVRKRLQSAGIAQEEIDAFLPVIPHEG